MNDDGLYEILESETVVLSLVSATGGVTVDASKSEHRVTITEDDPMPTVTITPALPSVEEGEAATFTVTLNGRAEADIVVTLTPSPGSGSGAAETADYVTGSVSVTFTSTGDSVKTLRLQTTEDEVYEGDEEVALDFSISGPATKASVPSTLTIEDDDAEIGFDPVVYRVGEGSGTVELRVSVLSGVLMETITLNYETSDGSAVAGTDYELTTGMLTLSPGISSFTFTVNILEDLDNVEVELAGVFSVALSVVDMLPAGVSLTSSVAIVEIIDNDEALVLAVELGFDPVTYRVGEGSGTVELRVSVLNGDLTEPITLNYETFDGSAVAGTDYEYRTGTLTLSSGATSFTFTVNILEDLDNVDVELAGVFSVALSVVDTLPAGVTLTSSVAIVEIIDNDEAPAVVATLRESELSVSEGDTGTLNIDLSAPASEDVTLTLTVVSGGSAVESVDYAPLLVPVVIRAGLSELTVSIRTIEDELREGTKLFELILSVVDGPAVIGAVDRVMVTITDDDEPPAVVATLRVSELSVSEGDTGTLNIDLSAPASEDVTLTLTVVSGGSAVESVDYAPLLVPVVIRAGLSELTVSIRTIEDELREGTKLFELILSVVDGPAVIGAVDRVMVTITDDDEPPAVVATLRESELSVSEGDTGTLNIDLSAPASEDVTLTLTVVSGGSAVESVDYAPLLVPVVIRAGLSELTVSIRTIEDELREGTKLFELILSVVDGPAVIGAVDRVMVTITDDDEPPAVVATLRESELSVSEGDTVTLNIDLSAPASEDVTLTLTVVSGGSAVESVDYAPLLVPVVIRAGLSELTVSIRTIEDELREETKLFELLLSVVDGPAVIGAVDRVMVTITDDDEPAAVVATLRESELSVSEGDTGTLNIDLSAPASEDVTLTLTVVSGGSAVESVDYAPLLVPVVIRAGLSELTVSIRTIEDELREGTKLFELILSVVDGPAVIGAVDRVMVTITDDDEPPAVVATLRVSELSVSEGDTGTLNIDLSAPASEDVTLTLTVVSGGSAVESVDYAPLLVPVVIRAGLSELTVSIRTIEDELREGTKLFELILSVVDGPAVIGAVDRVMVTITDDDEPPAVVATLRESELSVSEGDTVTLNIDLSAPASEDVTLTLTVVSGGSAVESVDYAPLLVPVVIRAGLSELTVSIRTIEDELREETKLFELILSVVDGPAVIGAVDRVMVTITDDDEPPAVVATLRVSELSVSEGDTGTLNIDLSAPASEDVTLTLTVVSGGSAVESVDYAPLLVPVVIRAGLSELTVSIRTIEDELREGTKLFELILSVVDGPAVIGAVDRVMVTITDDDEPPAVVATLRVSELSVSEGDTGTLNIDLSAPASEDVTLTLTVVSGGSAVESVDYAPLLVPVVIRAGLSELTVSIRTIEDELREGTKLFELILSVVDGPAVIGAVDRVMVTIIDDDEPPAVVATLRVSELSVSEGDTVTLNIDLSEPASEDVTLTLTVVSGGSAVESVDYEPLLVPVVIRAGLSELTVSIRTIEDELREETKLFELLLSVVDGPAVIGAVDRVMVTIIDDEEAPVVVTLRVSSCDCSGGEILRHCP